MNHRRARDPLTPATHMDHMTDLTIVFASWADQLGVPRVCAAPPPHLEEDGFPMAGPVWDGTTLYTSGFTSPQDWAHEIAHWAVADPGRHPRPNYGLGADWLGGFAKRDLDLSVITEEYEASALGICWIRSAGGDWMANALDHSWLDLSGGFVAEWGAYEAKVAPWIEQFEEWLRSDLGTQGEHLATAAGAGA